MADPFRLRVVKNLTALLAAQDSNSGFNFNLTDAVFRGRNVFGEDDPLPMVSILETPIAAEQLPPPPEHAHVSTGDWDLLIQGFVKDDKKHPTDPAYLLAADVVQKLAAEKKRVETERRMKGKIQTPLLGEKGVLDIFIGSPVHRPPDDVSAKTYFWLQIRLRIAENLEDPYA